MGLEKYWLIYFLSLDRFVQFITIQILQTAQGNSRKPSAQRILVSVEELSPARARRSMAFLFLQNASSFGRILNLSHTFFVFP